MKPTLALVLALASVSGLASAQEAAGAPPCLLIVDGELEKTSIGPWSSAVAALIEASTAAAVTAARARRSRVVRMLSGTLPSLRRCDTPVGSMAPRATRTGYFKCQARR